ncbi:MAG: hypothetical protein QM831_34630 [Kofleriaceae bacterium]
MACAQRGGGAPVGPTAPSAVLDPGNGSGKEKTNYQVGPAGFPVPADAATVGDTPPDHTFKIERKRDAVIAELRVNLKQMGFSIEDEYIEDRDHTHWYITKPGEPVVYKVTVAGDTNDHTLIILTVE